MFDLKTLTFDYRTHIVSNPIWQQRNTQLNSQVVFARSGGWCCPSEGALGLGHVPRSFGQSVCSMKVGPGGKKSVEGSFGMFAVCDAQPALAGLDLGHHRATLRVKVAGVRATAQDTLRMRFCDEAAHGSTASDSDSERLCKFVRPKGRPDRGAEAPGALPSRADLERPACLAGLASQPWLPPAFARRSSLPRGQPISTRVLYYSVSSGLGLRGFRA